MKPKNLILIVVFLFTAAAGTARSEDINRGKALFNDMKLGTNEKSCNSCHVNGSGIDPGKKTYSILGAEQKTIEEAVNFCIGMALSGEPLGQDSADMKDLVSYLKSLKSISKKGQAPGY